MKKHEALKIYNAAVRVLDSVDAGKIAVETIFGEVEAFCISKEDYEIIKPFLRVDVKHECKIGNVEFGNEYRMPVTVIEKEEKVYFKIPENSQTFFVADFARAINNTVTNGFYKKIKLSDLYEGENETAINLRLDAGRNAGYK